MWKAIDITLPVGYALRIELVNGVDEVEGVIYWTVKI